MSSGEQVFEVLCGELNVFKFGDLFLQRVVLLLKLFNLLGSHAVSLVSQLIAEVQVLRDGLLSLDICLNLTNSSVINGLLLGIGVFTLNCETHLGELEEEFEVNKEITVLRCMVWLQDECLDVTWYTF